MLVPSAETEINLCLSDKIGRMVENSHVVLDHSVTFGYIIITVFDVEGVSVELGCNTGFLQESNCIRSASSKHAGIDLFQSTCVWRMESGENPEQLRCCIW